MHERGGRFGRSGWLGRTLSRAAETQPLWLRLRRVGTDRHSIPVRASDWNRAHVTRRHDRQTTCRNTSVELDCAATG